VLIQYKLVPINAARPVTAAVPKPHVTRPRLAKSIVTKPHSSPRRHINRSLSPESSNFPLKVTAVKVPQGNPQHGLKDKGVIDSGCLRHMTGNMSYLSDFEELNGGYVAFGGNPKGGKFDRKVDEVFLVGYFNTDDDAAFEVKEPKFEGRKLESEVYVSPRSIAQSKKHDDKTKREAKGKSPVESLTGYRNLSAEFEDFSANSINEVNDVESLVPTVGQISTTSTNNFSNAGPSNAADSPTHGKSSYVDTSQLPDDPNMPYLEDITYSDDDEDVGAEADFTNLETTIPVSPIPTTRVHKDHHVTQIIGDLSLATQTRSMSRVAQDQGFEDPDHPDEVYKVVKALYGLHQAPRAWYETLANYLLENGFQRGKIDHKLFIKKQKDGKLASTPIDTKKPLVKNPDGEDVDVHTYRSMIGSLIYLTSSRPDIMFAVCACARFQVTPKASNLHAVKRIFRYLKGKPHLGLWYPKDSPFNLVSYLDSDYAGASLDRKFTTGGCQFLGCKLIFWQYKKQTVMATSSTESEYVAAAS
nr:uncharacterized mitochondrial protein AtMg00810-like [Tanacetum cinerariifolium]